MNSGAAPPSMTLVQAVAVVSKKVAASHDLRPVGVENIGVVRNQLEPIRGSEVPKVLAMGRSAAPDHCQHGQHRRHREPLTQTEPRKTLSSYGRVQASIGADRLSYLGGGHGSPRPRIIASISLLGGYRVDEPTVKNVLSTPNVPMS